MEVESGSHERGGLVFGSWFWLKAMPKKLTSNLAEAARSAKELGQDDPRRVTHSLKVGIAVTLISLIYYFQPLYHSFGVSAMWAVMTVVVVFEFSVGATIGKSLNRGMATMLAGALGLGAHHLASVCGKTGEPILLGIFVFSQAAASTFIRFYPRIKARYDYGMLIFILTFCFVSVSGFRNDELLDLAQKRISTILMGVFTCVAVSILVCPVWAGQDLHNLLALNIESLGTFLEGFGEEYFKDSKDEEGNVDKSFLQAHRIALNSKGREETLADLARWEPAHGKFTFRHPWKQYLKVGSVTRKCAYRIEVLSGYLSPDTQAPPEIRRKFQEACTEMSLECSKALKHLALAMQTMTRPWQADPHVADSKTSAEYLKSLLKLDMCEGTDLLKVVPVASMASLLADIVVCVEELAETVHELASLARFKSTDDTNVSPENTPSDHLKHVKPHGNDSGDQHHVIKVNDQH